MTDAEWATVAEGLRLTIEGFGAGLPQKTLEDISAMGVLALKKLASMPVTELPLPQIERLLLAETPGKRVQAVADAAVEMTQRQAARCEKHAAAVVFGLLGSVLASLPRSTVLH